MAWISKRGDTWQYTIKYKDKDGHQKRKSKGGFTIKRAAVEAAQEIEYQIKNGNFSENDVSLIDYYQKWLDTYKIGKHARVTEVRYNTIKKQLAAYFGSNKKLKDITRTDWQQFINFFGKTRAKETVSKLNSYVRSMANSAIDDGLIRTNFTNNTVLTGSKGKDEKLKYLQVQDYKKLKEYVFKNASLDRIFNYIIATGISTGARYSEVVAITWKDINFLNQTININKSWDSVISDFKPTKTESGNRIIEIDDDLTDLLRKLKQEQSSYFKEIKRPISINQLTFINKSLSIITNNALNKDLRNIESMLNINPLITFHGLRHTHVSYLISKGIDINYISHRLGHSNVSITMNIYTHLLKDYQKEEANRTRLALKSL